MKTFTHTMMVTLLALCSSGSTFSFYADSSTANEKQIFAGEYTDKKNRHCIPCKFFGRWQSDDSHKELVINKDYAYFIFRDPKITYNGPYAKTDMHERQLFLTEQPGFYSPSIKNKCYASYLDKDENRIGYCLELNNKSLKVSDSNDICIMTLTRVHEINIMQDGDLKKFDSDCQS